MCRNSRQSHVALDAALVDRLESLAGAALERTPEAAYSLAQKLTSAQLVAEPRLPGNVVTIGSTVTYLDQRTGRTQCVTLVWPDHVDMSLQKISVFSSIGVALLGLSSGDKGRWISTNGQEHLLTVILVTRDQMPIAAI